MRSGRAEPRVAVLATLDTKGEEAGYLREAIAAAGGLPAVVDVGTLGEPATAIADLPRTALAAAAGLNLTALRPGSEPAAVLSAMAAAAGIWLRAQHTEGRLQAAIGMGGSKGGSVVVQALRALPLGVPKLLVSPAVTTAPRWLAGTDIILFPTVTDLLGLNRHTRTVLDQAAAAAVALAGMPPATAASRRPVVLLSAFGVTTPCVSRCRRALVERGFEVMVFTASGTGGQAMEAYIEAHADEVAAVGDLTTTELTDLVMGGVCSAGPNRLEAAGRHGIPQVVAPGAVDFANFGPAETLPARLRRRRAIRHTPFTTLVRASRTESGTVGRLTGSKLSAAEGPVEVLVPEGGFSAYDAPNKPFHDPAADRAWLRALRAALRPDVFVREIPCHINDPTFAEFAAGRIAALARHAPEAQPGGGSR